jgi:anti-sigma B factor antagonist
MTSTEGSRGSEARLVLPTGEEKPLGPRGLTVGRARENDLWLNDPTVSRHHLRFEYVGGQPVVCDLNSANGTFVNGKRIVGTHPLRDGDRITVGRTCLVFRAGREASPASDREAAAPPAIVASVQERFQHRRFRLPDGQAAADLTPLGELTIEAADAFRALVAELLAAGITRFVLDLSQVSYLDSTGLGALVHLLRQARARGGGVAFYAVSPPVQELFVLTHLDKVLQLAATREAAIACLQQGEGAG